jgi:hypothetical protein
MVAIICLLGVIPRNAAAQIRPYRMGFTEFPPEFSLASQELLYEKVTGHADLISHFFQEGIPWDKALLSSDTLTYPATLIDKWTEFRNLDRRHLPGAVTCLALNPISVDYVHLAPYWGATWNMDLPAPWNSYAFNHPSVKAAFLNYAIAAIEFFNPVYVNLTVEANILMARNYAQWPAFLELEAYVYDKLKQRYPNKILFTSIQYEHMLGMHTDSLNLLQQYKDTYPDILVDQVRVLMRHSDSLSLSTYPYMVYGNSVTADYFQPAIELADQLKLRISIDQFGYTSKDLPLPGGGVLPGNNTLQTQFVGFVLYQAYLHNFQFVNHFVAMDYGTNYGDNFVFMTWAWAGLFSIDQTPKPALEVWDAFARLNLSAVSGWQLYR